MNKILRYSLMSLLMLVCGSIFAQDATIKFADIYGTQTTPGIDQLGEKVVGDIYARIRNADEQLTHRLHLDVQQAAILHDYMEQILEDLSNIDIELDSTETFDADNYFAGKARRNQMLATE